MYIEPEKDRRNLHSYTWMWEFWTWKLKAHIYAYLGWVFIRSGCLESRCKEWFERLLTLILNVWNLFQGIVWALKCAKNPNVSSSRFEKPRPNPTPLPTPYYSNRSSIWSNCDVIERWSHLNWKTLFFRYFSAWREKCRDKEAIWIQPKWILGNNLGKVKTNRGSRLLSTPPISMNEFSITQKYYQTTTHCTYNFLRGWGRWLWRRGSCQTSSPLCFSHCSAGIVWRACYVPAATDCGPSLPRSRALEAAIIWTPASARHMGNYWANRVMEGEAEAGA